MKQSYNAALALTLLILAACAEPEPSADPLPASAATRVMLQRQGTDEVSVYAFRRQGTSFLFDTLYREGWTADGRLQVRMANGSYKFLFVSGADEGFVSQPMPITQQTAWEDVAFALRANNAVSGTCLPAGELFLQYPPSAAHTVYTVGGSGLTVPARLTRAVCRIGIALKRGYREGAGYVEIPYAKPHSVLEEIERVEITARNTGRSITPDGSSGSATVAATLLTTDYTELTDSGFVLLDGPFILPPAEGSEIDLDISVVPSAGASLRPVRLQLTGSAERNKRLDITLWIASSYPEIGVEIHTAPIEREQEGDSGIWE